LAKVKVNGRSLVPLPPLNTKAFKFDTKRICYFLWFSIKVLSSLPCLNVASWFCMSVWFVIYIKVFSVVEEERGSTTTNGLFSRFLNFLKFLWRAFGFIAESVENLLCLGWR